MTDKETVAVYDAQVERYISMNPGQFQKDCLQEFMAELQAGDLVLDLGCGPGHWSAAMRERGLTVDATDVSAEMVRVANETYDINARVAAFTDIDAVEMYDGIWASFSLLHARIAEFPLLLSNFAAALKSKGFFFLVMKIGEGEQRDELGRLYSYYSEVGLVSHLNTAGFEVANISHGAGEGMAGNVEPWIALLCRKQVESTVK